MLYMNSEEISRAVRTFGEHPTLGPAARTLANLRDAVNANSDGWAYWGPPVRAARAVMALLGRFDRPHYWGEIEDIEISAAEVRACLAPLKAFRTRCQQPDPRRPGLYRYGARQPFTFEIEVPA